MSTQFPLVSHALRLKKLSLNGLFDADSERVNRFSVSAVGLRLDYSKNFIDQASRDELMSWARLRQIEAKRDALFAGETVNNTENRAVAHWALRAPTGTLCRVGGQDVEATVQAVLERFLACAEAVRSGDWRGASGQLITDVVNIGIGGSDLGPKMAVRALSRFTHTRLRSHFVSNVDGADLSDTLAQLDPATTLFIVASKTFTTAETLANAQAAKAWLLARFNTKQLAADAAEHLIAKHFVAVSTNLEKVTAFGIAPENMFGFWDWVGGRYSLWSAIGLSIAIAIGADRFREFLAGAHAMDRHFQIAPFEQNMPVILGLLDVFYRGAFDAHSRCVAPYQQRLQLFPAYLQQLEMESNGKRVSAQGERLEGRSSGVVWGEPGTNGQHAFFQLLHQGTEFIPVDFITALQGEPGMLSHHHKLLANCFAQSQALMLGDESDDPHRVFLGNKPSNTLLMDELNPVNLGALIALYEHRVFVVGALLGLNSFDQFGVELGKVLAGSLEPLLSGDKNTDAEQLAMRALDGSTRQLVNLARAAKRN
jgi:glucose-6-phosphate isomerase